MKELEKEKARQGDPVFLEALKGINLKRQKTQEELERMQTWADFENDPELQGD